MLFRSYSMPKNRNVKIPIKRTAFTYDIFSFSIKVLCLLYPVIISADHYIIFSLYCQINPGCPFSCYVILQGTLSFLLSYFFQIYTISFFCYVQCIKSFIITNPVSIIFGFLFTVKSFAVLYFILQVYYLFLSCCYVLQCYFC